MTCFYQLRVFVPFAMLVCAAPGIAQEGCPPQSAPAYKVCFDTYDDFLSNRSRLIDYGLKLDQYIPGPCFLENLSSEALNFVGAEAIEVKPLELRDIAPVLVGEVSSECSSHKGNNRCDPGWKGGEAVLSGELMVRLNKPATADCLLGALNKILRDHAPGLRAEARHIALELLGPSRDDDVGKSEQFKISLPSLSYILREGSSLSPASEERESRANLTRSLSQLGVVRIDPFEYATLRNGTTAGIIQSGDRYKKSLFERGLKGDGEVLGLIDDYLDTHHCFLNDVEGDRPGNQHRKLQSYKPNVSGVPSLHGTFVAGILAGESSEVPTESNNGQAPEARMNFTSVWDIASWGPIESVLYQALEAQHVVQSRIFSNSWGDEERGWYTNWAYDIDKFMRDYDDALVVFAVQNDGMVMTPENSKNVLAVGATKQANLHGEWGRAGRGPTCDGRRKPEIFAPGCQILSSIVDKKKICEVGYAPVSHHHGMTTSCATSWACPAVAGAAALARQHLGTPSGALLKATLLNATRDLPGEAGYPNDVEGWGRLLLDDSLYFAGEDRKVIMEDVSKFHGFTVAPSPSLRRYRVKVTDEKEPLKVTLVWTDPPPAATVRCEPVVNNLDLRMERLDCPKGVGCHFLGNYFSSAGVSEAFRESPKTGDEKNNVEQIFVMNPAVGDYCVSIVGEKIHVEKQGYALVVTGAVERGTSPADDAHQCR